ncbi:MAG TPA: hypothetical protein PK797_17080, partial [Burkholderiaceae bacterium]|nr:hypothetical protein [Burkholderiaceae bacterium]
MGAQDQPQRQQQRREEQCRHRQEAGHAAVRREAGCAGGLLDRATARPQQQGSPFAEPLRQRCPIRPQRRQPLAQRQRAVAHREQAGGRQALQQKVQHRPALCLVQPGALEHRRRDVLPLVLREVARSTRHVAQRAALVEQLFARNHLAHGGALDAGGTLGELQGGHVQLAHRGTFDDGRLIG